MQKMTEKENLLKIVDIKVWKNDRKDNLLKIVDIKMQKIGNFWWKLWIFAYFEAFKTHKHCKI
jgi:alpha-glucosidase (family GH31 glycosyl hydrolase)